MLSRRLKQDWTQRCRLEVSAVQTVYLQQAQSSKGKSTFCLEAGGEKNRSVEETGFFYFHGVQQL